MLNITKTTNGSELEIKLEGRLDTMTAPSLEEVMKSSLIGIKKLVFNLEEVKYISSAGLRVILAAQKIMNRQGEMVVRNASRDIRDIFRVTGFADILHLE